MGLVSFHKWVELQEQGSAPAAGAAGAVPAGMKDDAAKTDTQIKQVMAANLTDEKKRKTALQNLAKQMAMNPNAKTDALKKVADAMKSEDPTPLKK